MIIKYFIKILDHFIKKCQMDVETPTNSSLKHCESLNFHSEWEKEESFTFIMSKSVANPIISLNYSESPIIETFDVQYTHHHHHCSLCQHYQCHKHQQMIPAVDSDETPLKNFLNLLPRKHCCVSS